MRLIIHNDDLGLTYGFTEGIRQCYKKGVTTSTCIRTNGYAYKYSVSLLKNGLKDIGLGMHLNITQGKAHTSEIANGNGEYKFGFFGYFIRCLLTNGKFLKVIEKDFERQFEIAKKDGLKFDHVNGQDHVHMIPPIFKIVCKLAKKNKIKYIRICDENYYLTGNLLKDLSPLFNLNLIRFVVLKIFSAIDRRILSKYNLSSSQNFYGILHTNGMDEAAFLSALKNAIKRKLDVAEILSHPTDRHHKRDDKYITEALSVYANLPNRGIEKRALLSKRTADFILKNKIKLVNYRNL